MRNFLLLSVMMALTACSSAPPQGIPPPVSRIVQITTGKLVNPYGGDAAHPVVLRLYQLSEAGTFNNAAFIDIYQNDQTLLASSLVDSLYLDPIFPDADKQITIDIHFRSRYLAVLAEFSEYENAVAKAVLTLDEETEGMDFRIDVKGLQVSLVTQPKTPWWKKLF